MVTCPHASQTFARAAGEQYLARDDDLGLNQAVFEKLYIDDDEIVGADLTVPNESRRNK